VTDYEDVFELLEDVRGYNLRPKESIIPLNSVDGTVIGFVTAHTEYSSIEWRIPMRLAKATALARGSKEGVRIRDLLCNNVGRKQLLQELRDGDLNYGVAQRKEAFLKMAIEAGAHTLTTSILAAHPSQNSLIQHLTSEPAPLEPKQCLIPGL